jgi:hypothetical protein
MPTKIDTTIGTQRVVPRPLAALWRFRSARSHRVPRFANEAGRIRVSRTIDGAVCRADVSASLLSCIRHCVGCAPNSDLASPSVEHGSKTNVCDGDAAVRRQKQLHAAGVRSLSCGPHSEDEIRALHADRVVKTETL